jgi:hypothetical protein
MRDIPVLVLISIVFIKSPGHELLQGFSVESAPRCRKTGHDASF